MPHFGDRTAFHQSVRTQDGDAVTQSLDFAKDARGKKHGLAGLLRFQYAFPEHLFHQRIEADGRLVQQSRSALVISAAIRFSF